MRATETAPEDDLETRLRSIAEVLVARLKSVFATALGAPPTRPSQLIESLGLDKTLASKLMRGLKAEEPFRALFELPATQGLGIAASAAASAGVGEGPLEALSEAIDGLTNLQEEFPGGRAGLLAVLSGWLPETREKEDRHARQTAFRAMSTITGTRLDAIYNGYVYAPSDADPETCDTAWIVARLGLRRVRHGSSIRITSIRDDEGKRDVPRRLTLSGEPLKGSPRRLLIPEFCSDPMPDLQVQEGASRFDLVLGATSPPLNGAADLAFGSLSRGLVPRYRDSERRWEFTMQTATRPAVVLIADILVHKDLFEGRAPIVTTQLGLTEPDLRGPQAEQADVIDLPIEQQSLGLGLARVGSSDVPRCQEYLQHSLGQIGWDPNEFRVYRVRVPYPAPSITLVLWLELPAAPDKP